jgi:hypothetical protein
LSCSHLLDGRGLNQLTVVHGWDYLRLPLPRELNLQYIVYESNDGSERSKKSEGQSSGRFAHHLPADPEDIASKSPVTAGFAADFPKADPNAGEEFLLGAGLPDFGPTGAQGHHCMSVAAPYRRFSELAGECAGRAVIALQHAAIARLHRREGVLKPFEIRGVAAACERGEDMIGAIQKLLLVEISVQRKKIVRAALNFDVLPFGEVVNTDVNFGAAGKVAGYFFAKEKVGMAPEGLY